MERCHGAQPLDPICALLRGLVGFQPSEDFLHIDHGQVVCSCTPLFVHLFQNMLRGALADAALGPFPKFVPPRRGFAVLGVDRVMELLTTMDTDQPLFNRLRCGEAIAPEWLNLLFHQTDGGLEILVVLCDKRVVSLQVGHHTGESVCLSALCAIPSGQGLLRTGGSTVELHGGAGTGGSSAPLLALLLSGTDGSSARLLALLSSNTGGPPCL